RSGRSARVERIIESFFLLASGTRYMAKATAKSKQKPKVKNAKANVKAAVKPQQAKARVEAKALRSKAPERSRSAKSAVKVKSKTVKTTRPAAAKPAPKAAPRVVAEPKQQLALPAKAAKPGKEQAQDKSKAAEQARAIAKLRALRAQQTGAEAAQKSTPTRGARDRGARPGIEGARPVVQAVDAETRRMRLKTLIVLGKERSYLTYAEINDHLPDDMLDAEQIESVISMINDMGIQ